VVAGAVAVGLIVSSAASAGAVASKPTLTIGDTAGACGDLNPNDGPAVETRLAYEPLIRVSLTGKYEPALATSWNVRPGNKVITFTLRRGARFSDGTPVTAQAVATWLNWHKIKPTLSQFDGYLGVIASVKALSKWVVQLTLESPNPEALFDAFSLDNEWAFPVSPKAVAVMEANPKSPLLSRQTFGAGPYVVVPSQSVTNDHCTFVPNKYYYDQSKIRWGKVVTKGIPDPNAALAALRAGQIDILERASANTVRVAAGAGLQVVDLAIGAVHSLAWIDHAGKLYPPLADLRVRQALSYAVNRAQLVSVYGPRSQPTSVPFPAESNYRLAGPRYANYYNYDPAKARALLAAAGYAHGFTLKVITLGPWAGPYDETAMCNSLARDYAAIGVTMQVIDPGANDFGTDLFSKQYAGWCVSFNGPETLFSTYPYVAPPHGFDYGMEAGSHAYDPVGYKLWLKGERLSAEAGVPVWRQLIRRMIATAWWVPVVRSHYYTFVSKRVGGVTPEAGIFGLGDPITWYPTGK
jgi:peptide/nickel transport system substrate-binding protein